MPLTLWLTMGLQGADDLRSLPQSGSRVCSGRGSVSAAATDHDPEHIGTGHHRTIRNGDIPDGQFAPQVQSQTHFGELGFAMRRH